MTGRRLLCCHSLLGIYCFRRWHTSPSGCILAGLSSFMFSRTSPREGSLVGFCQSCFSLLGGSKFTIWRSN
ncbi:hypothetical protein RchiOBHm_Chr2g0114981 [Rosa chinensis]|uniref:Uncharacterized protein n=1 Tax=Rosa chinensis TaxID=74649 RepID=A0A2P6RQU8_ROSCH|nr:hypothetical protein RchiOBHm_Chr2g0114981 [Rosa chinensis]